MTFNTEMRDKETENLRRESVFDYLNKKDFTILRENYFLFIRALVQAKFNF